MRNAKINMLAKIQDAKPGQIAFLSNPKYENFIYTTQATAVIVSKEFTPSKAIASTLIVVSDPYLSFTVLLEEYHKVISFQKSGIEEPSFVGYKPRSEKIFTGVLFRTLAIRLRSVTT
jgi:UDP-3-O-[3-hydroxymyristoyl] glucosamine N-acyltransferase